MKRKLFIIIITFFIASCICPGAHRKAGIYEVDIKELNDVKFYKIYTYYFYEKDYTRGGYTVEPNISNVITNADTLGISFNFNLLSNKIGFNSTGFSLINSAYACSIGGDVSTFKYKIDSVLIT